MNTTRFLAARDLLGRVLPGEAATVRAAQEAIDGHRTGLRALWPFLGPAFIASVAYVDPGNFATDVAGGAKYGYLLLWAVLAANLMAMLVQTLSAKLGIATGRNLAEVCRDNLSRRVSFGLWVQAEVIAMATDLAEVLGAALGLSLLFGIPLGWGAVIAVAAAFTILALQASGFRQLEAVIAVFVGVIVVAFAFELLAVTPDPGKMADDLFSPSFDGEALLIAVGIIGATVMPHVIYLHSALTQSRVRGKTERELKRIQRFERIDVLLAMSIAGLVNLVHAVDLRRPLLRNRCGVDRGCLPRAARRSRPLGRRAARRRPARVRPLVVVGRHTGRTDRDAGLHPAADPAVRPARDHGRAGPDRGVPRRRADARAGAQPGRPLVRHPVRAGPARAVHEQPPRNGWPREQPVDDGGGVGDRGRDQLC